MSWILSIAASLALVSDEPQAPLYSFTPTSLEGEEVPLDDFHGDVLLVVNVASKCGYTPQYTPLQALFDKYEDDGLVVLGFPCNDFGRQEPGTEAEIAEFCEENYGVTFPMFGKVAVKGEGTAPLYQYLTERSPVPGEIRWNFEKFLVARNGEVVARWPSNVDPSSDEVVKAVERELDKDIEPFVPDHLRRAVRRSERSPVDLARDPTRFPAEVLAFAGIEPGMQIGDLMAGDGYYTELLAYAIGPEGKVYAQNNAISLRNFADRPLTERLKKETLKNVVRLDRDLDTPGFPEGELDVVMMVRFYHDSYWMKADRPAMNAAVLKSLKPGGVFCVIDHHAAEGSGARDVQRLHRVDAALVKKEILAAGFEFAAESDVLRDETDDRSWNIFTHERGARRDRTDRFVYLFRKPAVSGAEK